jgi:hypothetical protein
MGKGMVKNLAMKMPGNLVIWNRSMIVFNLESTNFCVSSSLNSRRRQYLSTEYNVVCPCVLLSQCYAINLKKMLHFSHVGAKMFVKKFREISLQERYNFYHIMTH